MTAYVHRQIQDNREGYVLQDKIDLYNKDDSFAKLSNIQINQIIHHTNLDNKHQVHVNRKKLAQR